MSVFLFSDIDSPLFRTNNAKEEHSDGNRSEHYFKRADYQWSSYPSSWQGFMSLMFTAMIPNISIILLPEYPVTFSFSSWVFLELHFLNLKISLLTHLPSWLLFTPAWMCRETTTHVMPLDSSGLMLSGKHPLNLKSNYRQLYKTVKDCLLKVTWSMCIDLTLFFFLLVLLHRLREHHRLQGLSSAKKWLLQSCEPPFFSPACLKQ